MANMTLSGYLTTEAAVAWAAGTDLDSLADNGWTSLSDEIDNGTTLYAMADLYFALGSAAFTGTDSTIQVYLVPSVDGTNYPTWATGTSDEQENNIHFVGSVTTSGTTATQKMVLRSVLLPNGKYKFAFRNTSGVTLAASANTISWRPHTYASA